MTPTLASFAFTALFLALFLLALAPNLSILIVTTRAASSGFKQGALATLGIVVATLLYVVAAVFLLKIVAAMRPEARQVLRLIAAIWMVWHGMGLIRNASKPPLATLPATQRDAASFAMGFILTLLNVKAIVFYVCFLPVFLNAGSLDFGGVVSLMGVVALAGFAARLLYVSASSRGRIVPGVMTGRVLNVVAGVVAAWAGIRLVAE
jgi:threonine/homoserine/homoserine lactone efflux protein